MKLKKVLATMMAVALAVSPMTVSASEMTVSASELTPPNSANVDVSGGASYVETTKYKVTLPTNNSLSFTLDPSGIFGYVKANPNATNFDKNAIDAVGTAGKIVGVGGHNIVNKSSVPVAVNCAYTLSTTASDVTFTTDTTLDETTISGNQICLKVVAGTGTVSGNEVAFTKGTYEKALAADATTGNDLTVLLGAADYEYTISGNNIDYVPKATGTTTQDDAALSIGGYISPNHDWTELASGGKKVKLNCVYSFRGVKASNGVTLTDKVVTANADKIVYLDGSGSSNALTGTYSKASGAAFSMPLNGFDVKTVTVTSKPGTASLSTPLNTTTHYTLKDGNFYLKTAWVSGLTTGTWTFDLSDGTTTKTLTLTVTN